MFVTIARLGGLPLGPHRGDVAAPRARGDMLPSTAAPRVPRARSTALLQLIAESSNLRGSSARMLGEESESYGRGVRCSRGVVQAFAGCCRCWWSRGFAGRMEWSRPGTRANVTPESGRAITGADPTVHRKCGWSRRTAVPTLCCCAGLSVERVALGGGLYLAVSADGGSRSGDDRFDLALAIDLAERWSRLFCRRDASQRSRAIALARSFTVRCARGLARR